MNGDFYEFIARGRLGEIRFGTPWSRVMDLLGQPPLYEPMTDSLRTEDVSVAKYGDIEFTIGKDTVRHIKLAIWEEGIELPASLSMINFEEPDLHIDEVRELLEQHKVSWEPFDWPRDDWYETYRTEAGVFLVFGGDILAVVSAGNPATYWGT